MSLAQLKRAARLSSRDFAGCVAKQDFIDVLEAPAYNEAFTLNTQEPYQRGYVVKHDDRSTSRRLKMRQSRKRDGKRRKRPPRRSRRRRNGLACRRSRTTANPLLNEEEDSDSDETTAGSPSTRRHSRRLRKNL